MDRPDASQPQEPARGHNQIVFGRGGKVFFSHLAMFMAPHDRQVIMEVSLSGKGSDPHQLYVKDREAHPEAPFYSLEAEPFVLSDILPPASGGSPKVDTVFGNLFRGQFEQLSGSELPKALVASNVAAKIEGILVNRKLLPLQKRPAQQEYILFGSGEERYVAHAIYHPPDFDDILAVTAVDRPLTDAQLAAGITIGLPGRKNAVADAIPPDSKVHGETHTDGKVEPIEMTVGDQVYRSEADFKPMSPMA